MWGFVDLGQYHGAGRDRRESLQRRGDAIGAGGAADDQMGFVGFGGSQHIDQLLDPGVAAWRTTGGVDQHQVDVAQSVQRLGHLIASLDDLHRQIHDVGVRTELLHRGDPERIDGQQSDSPFGFDAKPGGQFGDRGGFAHAGRSDQRDDSAVTRLGANRAADAKLAGDAAAKMIDPVVGGVSGFVIEQPGGQRRRRGKRPRGVQPSVGRLRRYALGDQRFADRRQGRIGGRIAGGDRVEGRGGLGRRMRRSQ